MKDFYGREYITVGDIEALPEEERFEYLDKRKDDLIGSWRSNTILFHLNLIFYREDAVDFSI